MTDTWIATANHIVNQNATLVTGWRRQLHRGPELSGEEFKTTEAIAEWLSSNQLEPRILPSGRGVIVDIDLDLRGTRSESAAENLMAGQSLAVEHPVGETFGKRRIGYRADIDALSIQDAKTTEYASGNPGVMHACGHDAHTAILIGTIKTLLDLEAAGELPWPVAMRGLFQPAEEICQGALEMLAADACSGLQALLGLHVDPSREVGSIGCRDQELTAHFDELIFEVTGGGGHGARPHLTNDTITAAAALIQAVQVQVTRRINAHHPIAISFGQINGGSSPNVIPEHVVLKGTMRTLRASVRTEMLASLNQVTESIETMFGVGVKFSLGTHGPAVNNDRKLTELVRKAASHVIGQRRVEQIDEPSMGGEDFAFYGSELPELATSMFRLGTHSPSGPRHRLHTSIFDIDEAALVIGTKIMVLSIIDWSKPTT